MAGKFIELTAAAAQLGISTEKLQDMREAGEIHGYKDGVTWKFKVSEIERVAKELTAPDADQDLSSSDSAPLSGEEFEQLLEIDESIDASDELDNSSILISGEPDSAGDDSSSTVIGRNGAKAAESALKLSDDSSEEDAADSAPADDGEKASDDDYELKLADSEDMSDALELSDDLEFESDDALELNGDGDVSLSDDSDGEYVVEADSESSEGDLAIGSSDSSGVASPSDSGLSLEGESSSEALELPEDDEMISLENGLAMSSDDSTELQQDEEFLLSPSDEMLGDESSDSGSQVIALDDSTAFESDSDAEGLEGVEPVLVPEEADAMDVPLEPIESAAAVAGAISVSATEAPEAEYTAWNIAALLFVVILLSVSGMLMADVVRNMWLWNGDVSATNGLANSITDALGMK